MRQNDEPDREHLGVTSEQQDDPGGSGVGGWDRRLWLGKADEGRGVSARSVSFPASHHSDA